MSIKAHSEALKQEYEEYATQLGERESFIENLQSSLRDENFEELISDQIEIVEDARHDLMDTLSRKGKVDMKSNNKDLNKMISASLEKNEQYRQRSKDLKEAQVNVDKTVKALRVVESSSWSQLSQEWMSKVNAWWKKTKHEPKGPRDEAVAIQRLVLIAQERVDDHERALQQLKDLVRIECEAQYIRDLVTRAKKSADDMAILLTSEFREFSTAFTELTKQVTKAKALVGKHLQENADLIQELNSTMTSYEARLTALKAQFELLNVKQVMKQGTPEFIATILQALESAGLTHIDVVPTILTAVSKCSRRQSQIAHSGPERTEWSYEDMKAGSFSPLIHQRAVAMMARPDYNMNLLVFGMPGVGKTCLLDLSLQNMAQYYLNNPPESILPSVLVLVQNQASIPTYLKEMTRAGCVDSDSMQNLKVKKVSESVDTHEWAFVKSSGPPVMRVVVHRMTKALEVLHDWNRGPPGSLAVVRPVGIKKWELPRVGAVIVDEAHNLFNTSQMKTNTSNNHAKKFLQQMIARPDLKRILSTGTPTLDSDRFDDLARLLDFLRLPESESKEKQISSTSNLEQHIVNRSAEIHQKTLDKWFDSSVNGAYLWREGAEDTFKQEVSGYISYMSLENDFGVYPRFEVTWEGQHLPGRVEATFSNNKFSISHTGLSGKRIMSVMVPSDKAALKKEKTYKTPNGAVGVHFQTFEELRGRTPPKWEAVKCAFDSAPLKKHFVFLGKSDIKSLKRFVVWLSDYKKLQEFNLPAHKGTLQASVENFYEKMHPAERYIILEKESDASDFLEYYNDPRNYDGSYIRYVFGSLVVKEGISLATTHYVHIIEPPMTATVFDQAIRRAARYCSMREIADIKLWQVTVIVYVAESKRERDFHDTIMQHDSSPVTLAYEAMKSAAIDCYLYSSLTGVECFNKPGSARAKVDEYCIDPSNNKSKLIIYTSQGGATTTEERCIASECIPGGLLSYDLWDETLRQLLVEEMYEAKPLTIKGLVRKFSKHAQSVDVGIWSEQFQTPRLTFSRSVAPEVLATWIMRSPPAIGDAVLYLLEQKRAAANAAHVAKLQKKAMLDVDRIHLQMSIDATLKDKLKQIKLLRLTTNTDREQLLDASLRVKERGAKLKAKRTSTPKRKRT